jgi:hypothetical protein
VDALRAWIASQLVERATARITFNTGFAAALAMTDVLRHKLSRGLGGITARRALIYVVLLLATSVSWLFFPEPPPFPPCPHQWRSLGYGMHLLTNCDSAEFLRMAQEPTRVFMWQHFRQSPIVAVDRRRPRAPFGDRGARQ